jgi:hypothetical protein
VGAAWGKGGIGKARHQPREGACGGAGQGTAGTVRQARLERGARRRGAARSGVGHPAIVMMYPASTATFSQNLNTSAQSGE